jgi:hypothetical protein
VQFCRIEDMCGIASGQGYGVHVATQNGLYANVDISHNFIKRCGRHSVYVARGNGVSVIGNTIIDHRANLTAAEQIDGTDGWATGFRPAVNVSRSSHVLVTGNRIHGPYDGGILVNEDPDASGGVTLNVEVSNNLISLPANEVPALCCGDSAPATSGFPEVVAFMGNQIYTSGRGIDQIRHYAGKHVSYRGNRIVMVDIPAGTTPAMDIRATSDSGGTRNYTDKVVVEENYIYMSTSAGATMRGVRIDSSMCTSIAEVEIDQMRHIFGATVKVFEAVAVTNTNYRKRTADGSCMGIYANGDTTPSVANGIKVLNVVNSGATSITTLDDGEDGQLVTLKFADANTTLVNSVSMRLAGAVNATSTNLDTLTLVLVESAWYEVGRSVN